MSLLMDLSPRSQISDPDDFERFGRLSGVLDLDLEDPCSGFSGSAESDRCRILSAQASPFNPLTMFNGLQVDMTCQQ